jgi:hypothetical protein
MEDEDLCFDLLTGESNLITLSDTVTEKDIRSWTVAIAEKHMWSTLKSVNTPDLNHFDLMLQLFPKLMEASDYG